MPTFFRSVLLAAMLLAGVSRADNWPQWRGPSANNQASQGDYPLTWSHSENVLWRAKLPGGSGSTPVVWGDKILLTCPDDGKNTVICLDRNGNKLWQTKINQERPGKHRKGSGSNPSPVTDGVHVYVYYKSGDLACLNMAGKVVWQKNLQQLYGEDSLWWDLGTSPVLSEKSVIVACIQDANPYIVALNKRTGEVHWKADRKLPAPTESAQSYSTPLVMKKGRTETLVVLGGDHVTAHNVSDGKELWRVGGLNPTGDQYFRSIASPVISGDLVVAPYARGRTLTAIRLGGTGNVTDSHVAWTKKDISADVPSPAEMNGKVYVCGDRRNAGCIDAKTGSVVWMKPLPKSRSAYSASPILAGGKLYLTREDGTIFVLDTENDGEILATNSVEEKTIATPVLANGRILIRTFEHLYCIGK